MEVLKTVVAAWDAPNGQVVLSLGKKDGVLEGDEFTIYRGSGFIAKVTVMSVAANSSSARVTLKKEDPRVGDEASNSIFLTSGNK